MPWLSLMLFLPLLGACAVLAIPKDNRQAIHVASLATSALSLMVSLGLFFAFDRNNPGIQFAEKADWVPAFSIQYSLGVDGLSFPIVLLTTLLSFLSLIASLGIRERIKEYFFWFLILETGMLGVFTALDFFLFYIFWEIVLVPMYFLIGIWGGPQKEYAAIKFFLYTLLGSLFILLGILALFFGSTPHTFDILELARQNQQFSRTFQIVVFLALYIGFAVKIPAFPFHTWLPLAHVEAPTPVSVILAGVLLKMGLYGLLRVSFPILPQATQWFLPILVLIAVINIIYGALVAMAQTDLKKMVAYSSINHMGYCLLGIAALSPTGFNGAVLQMINHGIITGSLFLLVGVLYDRAHTREMTAFGGLGVRVPIYTGLMTLAAMASLGLPGLAGFISEFLCFLGAFPVWKWYTVASVAGIVITAGFFLRMLQKVFMGPLNAQWGNLPDIRAREILSIAPLTVLTVALGLWPRLALDLMNQTLIYLSTLIQ
ncbi:MAG: NADH-quinone oxidoreductase subunit M [Elusimicrobia bacterium]|nr:NADH-quinone oxidoreductase subunit M [Elusimicrobiota bacterium]